MTDIAIDKIDSESKFISSMDGIVYRHNGNIWNQLDCTVYKGFHYDLPENAKINDYYLHYKQITNLLKFSEDFNEGNWVSSNVIFEKSDDIQYPNNSYMSLMYPSNYGYNEKSIYQDITSTPGLHTFTLYAKFNLYYTIGIELSDLTNDHGVYYAVNIHTGESNFTVKTDKEITGLEEEVFKVKSPKYYSSIIDNEYARIGVSCYIEECSFYRVKVYLLDEDLNKVWEVTPTEKGSILINGAMLYREDAFDDNEEHVLDKVEDYFKTTTNPITNSVLVNGYIKESDDNWEKTVRPNGKPIKVWYNTNPSNNEIGVANDILLISENFQIDNIVKLGQRTQHITWGKPDDIGLIAYDKNKQFYYVKNKDDGRTQEKEQRFVAYAWSSDKPNYINPRTKFIYTIDIPQNITDRKLYQRFYAYKDLSMDNKEIISNPFDKNIIKQEGSKYYIDYTGIKYYIQYPTNNDLMINTNEQGEKFIIVNDKQEYYRYNKMDSFFTDVPAEYIPIILNQELSKPTPNLSIINSCKKIGVYSNKLNSIEKAIIFSNKIYNTYSPNAHILPMKYTEFALGYNSGGNYNYWNDLRYWA